MGSCQMAAVRGRVVYIMSRGICAREVGGILCFTFMEEVGSIGIRG